MDLLADAIHYVIMPLDGQSLLSLVQTSKLVRSTINKHIVDHPRFWYDKLTQLLGKSVLYRPLFEWNKIYWNFCLSSVNKLGNVTCSFHVTCQVHCRCPQMDQLGKLAATHLHTLKVARETGFSHTGLCLSGSDSRRSSGAILDLYDVYNRYR